MAETALLRSLAEASKRADELPGWAKEIAANLDEFYGHGGGRSESQQAGEPAPIGQVGHSRC